MTIPSIKQVVTAMNLPDADAESLRFETRIFLMDQNEQDNAKVAKLNVTQIKKLARKFLNFCGHAYFPASGGKCPFVWGENDEELVKHITMIMVCQSKSKLNKLRKKQGACEEIPASTSGSESEPEFAKRRLATVDRAYCPGGHPSAIPSPRSYRTRSTLYSDIPIMQSIELGMSGSGETGGTIKRRCMTTSTADGDRLTTDSAPHTIELARSQQAVLPQHSISRTEITESVEFHGLVSQPYVPSLSLHPHAKKKPKKGALVDLPSGIRQARCSSTSSVMDHPPNVQNKPLKLTPFPSSPTWDLHFDRVFSDLPDAHSTADNTVQPGITVPSARSWDLTPPASSAPEEENDVMTTKPMTKRQRRDQTTIEPEDVKFLLNYDSTHTVVDQIDLTGPDTVMIHLGEDNFKVIEKTCAVKILQKLIDFHVNSLGVYKRRTHQAPTEGQRRIYGLKAESLSKLLHEACMDESIWQGGKVDDPTVSML